MGKSRERAAPKHGRPARVTSPAADETIRTPVSKIEAFEPRTKKQATYVHAMSQVKLVFGIGPAGTGKTYCAAHAAAEAYCDKLVDTIIVCRPALEAGEKLGFLPGDLNEKTDPYMVPIIEALERRLGKGHVEALVKNGRIQVVPLAYMRGRSFRRAFVILDEAQNATKTQMKMFLTRMEEDAIVVVDGDHTQVDLPAGVTSGLLDAVDRLKHLAAVRVVRFTKADIVRSGLVQDVVECYEQPSNDTGELPLAA
jgi:phosphate starvation-inducible PhoH-like protein